MSVFFYSQISRMLERFWKKLGVTFKALVHAFPLPLIILQSMMYLIRGHEINKRKPWIKLHWIPGPPQQGHEHWWIKATSNWLQGEWLQRAKKSYLSEDASVSCWLVIITDQILITNWNLTILGCPSNLLLFDFSLFQVGNNQRSLLSGCLGGLQCHTILFLICLMTESCHCYFILWTCQLQWFHIHFLGRR